jgi:tryptophan-rich sensory protein
MRRPLTLLAFIAVCQAAGALGALTTDTGRSEWYASLVKPAFMPPGWLFGPVWITLYTLMGIAAFLVFERSREAKAWVPFWIQLALNAVWTPIFFGAKAPGLALLVIGLLWVTLVVTVWAFWHVRRSAGALLVPYLAWVSFAAVLNASIVVLN